MDSSVEDMEVESSDEIWMFCGSTAGDERRTDVECLRDFSLTADFKD